MCGISGEKLTTNSSRSLLSSIGHRGPDHKGVFENELVRLVHDRLSIVDLSEMSNQPMANERFVILFNGEIYNYTTLRMKYKSMGYTFKSSGDTEVILAGFSLLGVYSFDLLDGMFAIVIYDLQESKIYLCRDILGIKPLYYYYDANSFAFSSEIRGFSSKISMDRNDTARVLFHSFGFIPEPETHLAKINAIEPGQVCMYNLNNGLLEIIRSFDLVRNKYLANEDLAQIINANFKLTFADEVNSAVGSEWGIG